MAKSSLLCRRATATARSRHGGEDQRRSSNAAGAARRRSSAARPAPSMATMIGVDQEQRQRRRQQDAAQVARFGIGVAGALRAQARRIERRDAVGRRQRVDRERAVGRAVEARRMIRRARGRDNRPASAWRSRAAVRTRRSRRACAAAPPSRPWRLAGDARARLGGVAGHVDDPPQHLDEAAGHRQIRPAHVGADMEQADHALAAMFAGDQRRAVFQRGPALGREHRIRFGQHLPVDGDVLRHGKARERSVGGEGSQMLRLFPGQAAAEDASAAAQFDRHQIVIGLRQTRAGETHQHAALFDPGVEALADFRRQRADIGQHDHRQLLVEELRDRLLRRAAVAEPHVGERRQRAGQIEGRGQQRLRGVAGRAADDADRRAAASACRAVAPRRRSVRRQFPAARCRCAVRPADRTRLRSRGPARRTRSAPRRSANPWGRARAPRRRRCRRSVRSTFTVIFAAAFSAATSASGGGRAALEHRQRAIADGLAEAFDEIPVPRPVSTPSDSQAISQSPVAFRKRSSAGSVSTRSTE